ncbi:MAG: hypothetical protein PHR35_20330 [Kiritimatiellae bacterium]|nr:hypothetical protein [Kiritimatiellia bacterium]
MKSIRKPPKGYESKFADFIAMCAKAKTDGVSDVVVDAPCVIGDNYEEVMESLSRLASANLALKVAAPPAGK